MKNKLFSILRSEFFTRFLTVQYLPRWAILFIDITLVLLSIISTYKIAAIININGDSVLLPFSVTSNYLIIIAIQIFFFWMFHTYSGILRYSSYVDAAKLFLAEFLTVLVLLLINYIIKYFYFDFQINLLYLLSYLFISFFFLFTVRVIVKLSFDFLSIHSFKFEPIIIYGTDFDAVAIAKSLGQNGLSGYRVVAFLDTNKQNYSKRLRGVRVFPFPDNNVILKLSKMAQKVVVAPSVMELLDPKTDFDIFINNGITVMKVPNIEKWNESNVLTKQIKSIQIEDLLNRPPVSLDTEKISNSISNQVVLVTGAAGSIGSEIARQCMNYNAKAVVLLDQSESSLFDFILSLKESFKNSSTRIIDFIGDVRNKDRMEYMLNHFRPSIIFHAAAYKHVPLMEDNPSESVQVNIKGTKILADLAVKYEVDRFVMVSTDKAVNPTNVMGASKRIAEIYVQSLNNEINKNGETNKTKFITTRFGNVLGSNGSVIPIFKKQIEKGGPITVTHPEVVRYFMTIPEACLLVLEAGAMGDGGEIFIFDMGSPVNIFEMAKKMIRLAGFKPGSDIPIEFTGLRPGEKLYEELLNNKEKTKETYNKKIMIAVVREYDFNEVSDDIEQLIEESYKGKDYPIVSLMKKIVPEYKSNNSRFERLDEEFNTL